jgi:hypothetical protein
MLPSPALPLTAVAALPGQLARPVPVPSLSRGVRSRSLRVDEHGDPGLGFAGRTAYAPTVGARGQGWGVEQALAPRPLGIDEVEVADDRCPPSATSQFVCAENAVCGCPLSGRVSDAERAAMNDIFAQAARLSTVFSWIVALVAVAAVLLFVLG